MVLKRFNMNGEGFSIAGMGSFIIKKQMNVKCMLQSIATPIIPNPAKISKQVQNDKAAFSLVEMLMALLVASLLLAALAPVVTKRMNENMHITGEFSQNTRSEIREIKYGDPNFCNRIVRDSNNNPLYCEGEFVVPQGFKNITVTAIGGGGGGGTAPTAGYTEFTIAGSLNNFIVPVMVHELEATLIGGGAPGGAGGQVKKTQKFTKVGSNTFKVPSALKNHAAVVNMCGGGGGGGKPFNNACWGGGTDSGPQGPGGGGSGGYFKNKAVNFAGDNDVQVYVGGAGASPATKFTDYPNEFFTDKVITPDRSGITAEDGSGGAGGITRNRFVQGGEGGAGGHSAGGTGGKNYGFCGTVGGGGGGGGASRLCVKGQSCYLYVGGGGGGGGAGIWNTSITPNAIVSGGAGGGGGGTGLGGAGGLACERNLGCLSGGGGGGLPGGNAGSPSVACTATAGTGGISPLAGYPDNCRGGDLNTTPGNGIVAITYLDYGPGASGGGGGHIVPLQKISVTPAETLSVSIGRGLEGSKAGKINSDGTIKEPGILTTWDDKTSTITKISRGATQILGTPGHNAGKGLSGGSYTGEVLGNAIGPYYAGAGWSTAGVEPYNIYKLTEFTATNGRTAGNSDFIGNKTYAAETSGGDGGKVTTPWFECTPGRGARTSLNSSYTGGNASGYGCGGGGGFALNNGGNGSGGYARISWNMYWDSTLNSGGAYKHAQIGAGGGGASGNVVKETIRVTENQVIKIRIGAGGSGARVVNNTIIPANPGGTTIFGDVNFIEIKAGGGGAGESPSVITNNGTLINGKGGKTSQICDVGSHKYIDNRNYCTKGKPGGSADDNSNKALGGTGADFVYDIYKGTGGLGGIQDTGENSNGKNADANGISAGGGGAAIRIFNAALAPSNVVNNPNKGGDGAPGRIILKLWE